MSNKLLLKSKDGDILMNNKYQESKMSIKLIASDLDGTLMAPDHLTVTERTKKALLDAHNKGIKIAIATGRTLHFTDNVTKQIPFVDYVICSNGAAVYDRNTKEYIYKNMISIEDTAETVRFLNRYPVYYNVYTDGLIFVQKGVDKFFINPDMPQVFIDAFSRFATACDDLASFLDGKGAELIDIFASDKESHDAVIEFCKEKNLILASAAPGVNSATAAYVDKGNALRGIIKHLGISADELMTFGDAYNDCPMLELAGYSFAVENSVDECKRVAKFIAPSNGEDGVAQMIEKYVLDK